MPTQKTNVHADDDILKLTKATSTVASGSTIDLSSTIGYNVVVSGTTTIAGIVLFPWTRRLVRFSGALTLTYGATTIVTPGALDLTVAAGDLVEFQGEADGVVRVIRVVRASAPSALLAATNTLVASDSGRVLFLNHATEFATTLPALAAGLRFTFVVTAAPSGADYTIVTASSANIIKGQIYTLDVNSATDPDFETSGGDTVSFVGGKSVAGDRLDLICDGTNWFAYGFCSVFDAMTITTAS